MFLQKKILGGDFIKIEKWCNHEIRFVEKDGEWWAVATDIANALGHRDANNALKKMKAKYKGTHKVSITSDKLKSRKTQNVIILNEKGIYRLIMRSNKPEAEEFQDFVYEVIKGLREASGYEGFEIFRMLEKEHQKEMMKKLQEGLKKPARVDFIKANTIANKAVSLKHGYPKMIKKATMTPEMLKDREPILADTVELMAVKDKYGLDVSVSDTIYKKNEEKVG